jgi:acyl-CoA reductase-like NAD-dependent aldehyde dehydrogenase
MIQRPDSLFINGGWTPASRSSMLDVINSGTEELFASVAEAQAEDKGSKRGRAARGRQVLCKIVGSLRL